MKNEFSIKEVHTHTLKALLEKGGDEDFSKEEIEKELKRRGEKKYAGFEPHLHATEDLNG